MCPINVPHAWGVDLSKLMTAAGVTELMRGEHNWTKRYSTCEKIMAQIPLTVNSKDSLMAFSHLRVTDPELTVFAALPMVHLVTNLWPCAISKPTLLTLDSCRAAARSFQASVTSLFLALPTVAPILLSSVH